MYTYSWLYIYIYYTDINIRAHIWCEGFPTRKAIDPSSKRGQTAKPVRTVASKSSAFVFGGGSVSDDLGRDEMTCLWDSDWWQRKCRVIVIWNAGTSGSVCKSHFCRANTEIALDYFEGKFQRGLRNLLKTKGSMLHPSSGAVLCCRFL